MAYSATEFWLAYILRTVPDHQQYLVRVVEETPFGPQPGDYPFSDLMKLTVNMPNDYQLIRKRDFQLSTLELDGYTFLKIGRNDGPPLITRLEEGETVKDRLPQLVIAPVGQTGISSLVPYEIMLMAEGELEDFYCELESI